MGRQRLALGSPDSSPERPTPATATGRHPHSGRGPGRHHPHLADQPPDLLRAALLGEHPQLFDVKGATFPAFRHRLPTSSTSDLAAGPSVPTPTSSTTTRSTRATT